MTPRDFSAFVGGACQAAQDAPFPVILAIADPSPEGDILVMGLTEDEFAAGEGQQHLLAKQAAAVVTRVQWAPDDDSPTTDARLLVAVTPELDAVFAVKRDVEDDSWWNVGPQGAPWFALSTAGALREMLRTGKPLEVKTAFDARLFKRPDEVPTPPVDEQGRL